MRCCPHVGAFFLFSVGLGLLGHALLYHWALRTVPWVRRHRRLAAALLAGLALLAPVCRLLAMSSHSAWLGQLAVYGILETLTVLIGALLTAVFSGLSALGFGVAGLVRGRKPAAAPLPLVSAVEEPARVAERAPTPGPVLQPAAAPASLAPDPALALLGRRLVLERGLGLAAYGTVGSVLGWGMIHGRHDYTVEELVIRVPGLSPKLDGYTIAQVSDLHAGLLVDEAEFDRGFAFLRKLRPDLVVATGDLVDHDAGYAPMLARKLAELGARDGTFAILGNHDYYAGAQRVQEAMERAGVNMLVNDSRHLRTTEGPGLVLLGVDDFAGLRYRGRGPDLDGTLRRLAPEAREAPRILLAHQPPFFDQVYGRAALQLSGHTHGGQINLAGIQSAKLVGMRYVEGRYAAGPDSTLWVNRGFGVAGPPSRVGAPPEITKIVLVAA